MKAKAISLLALVLGCWTAQAADTATIKQAVKAKTEEINKALIKGDFAKIADLTHPNAVKLLGGREKMIAVMESGIKDMKAKGFEFRSVKIYDPSDPVSAGTDLFVVVPFEMEMKIPGGKARAKSFVIGVSSDQGKSWTFVNGDLDIKKVKQVLPNLPKELKLPEKEKPIVEKD